MEARSCPHLKARKRVPRPPPQLEKPIFPLFYSSEILDVLIHTTTSHLAGQCVGGWTGIRTLRAAHTERGVTSEPRVPTGPSRAGTVTLLRENFCPCFRSVLVLVGHCWPAPACGQRTSQQAPPAPSSACGSLGQTEGLSTSRPATEAFPSGCRLGRTHWLGCKEVT